MPRAEIRSKQAIYTLSCLGVPWTCCGGRAV
jgi:hypothetical protein